MAASRLRLPVAALLAWTLSACGGTGLGREYEYDEQLYLGADGSASVVLNASIPALIALRGLPLDPAPRARIDRNAIREMVAEPGLEITRVSRPWRRDGRQFIQIRADVDHVGTLASTKLFGWSRYDVGEVQTADGTARTFHQVVGDPASSGFGAERARFAGWTGNELVAFKLHLPSRIQSHNVRDIDTNETRTVERGNILTWEQRLGERLAGTPIDMQVQMDPGSILYRTLLLFGLSFGAAVGLLAAVIWMVIRRGRQRAARQ